MKRISVSAAILILFWSPESYANEQRLQYDDDTYVYELIFNDTRISVSEMRQIACLSPYTSYCAPFIIGADSKLENGREIVDKVFLAPRLEDCIAGTPQAKCVPYDSWIPDTAQLRNAAKNLKTGEHQVERLRSETLPSRLEPVRAYLLDELMRSLDQEKARYAYLKSSDLGPMRNRLCSECSCGPEEQRLLQQLSTTADSHIKPRLSRDWANKILECRRNRRLQVYPINAWRRFVMDYGITERRRYKNID